VAGKDSCREKGKGHRAWGRPKIVASKGGTLYLFNFHTGLLARWPVTGLTEG